MSTNQYQTALERLRLEVEAANRRLVALVREAPQEALTEAAILLNMPIAVLETVRALSSDAAEALAHSDRALFKADESFIRSLDLLKRAAPGEMGNVNGIAHKAPAAAAAARRGGPGAFGASHG